MDERGTQARRAVRALVEIAIENGKLQDGLQDVALVPPTAPEETLGEVSYLTGRAKEAAGDPNAALTAYAQVTQRSRFWAQATYLQGLIHVEKGRFKEGENLFCKIADPKRSLRRHQFLQTNDSSLFAIWHASGLVAWLTSNFDSMILDTIITSFLEIPTDWPKRFMRRRRADTKRRIIKAPRNCSTI